MLNCGQIYHALQFLYNSRSRKEERKRLWSNVYVDKNLTTGDLVVGTQGKRYKYEGQQTPGSSYIHYRAVKIPFDQISFDPQLCVSPTGIKFLCPPSASVLRAMRRFFRAHIQDLRGSKQGSRITIHSPYGAGQNWSMVGEGSGDLQITDTGIVFDAPVRHRTFIKEKQLELNRLIIRVRRAIRVRNKLGAFADLTFNELHKRIITNPEIKPYYRDRGAIFFRSLQQIDVENLDSFYPALYLATRGGYSRYHLSATVDWTKEFNLGINRHKEDLLIHTGAVVYC